MSIGYHDQDGDTDGWAYLGSEGIFVGKDNWAEYGIVEFVA